MTIEIERRFLLKNNSWRTLVNQSIKIRQGYLNVDKERTIRIRIVGEQAWLTVKGYISDISRYEFDYEIPLIDAEVMLNQMCPFVLEKTRFLVKVENFIFEIDEYYGENAPLIVAEVELTDESINFPKPQWLGEEITQDGRFSNAYLSKHPYASWPIL